MKACCAVAWRRIVLCCMLVTSALHMPVPMAENLVLGQPLSNSELDSMRGGFIAEDGVQFAFSFDSVTRVNGEILSQTSVVVPVLSLVNTPSSGASQALAQANLSLASITGGQPVSAPQGTVLIQNHLDRQLIETSSLINLQVFGANSLSSSAARSAMLPSLVAALKQ